MFDPDLRSLSGPNWYERTITLCAIGMGVGFGTCGLVTLTRAGEGRMWMYVQVGGAGIFALSLAVFLLATVVKVVSRVIERFR